MTMQFFEALRLEKNASGEVSCAGSALFEARLEPGGRLTCSITLARAVFDLLPGQDQPLPFHHAHGVPEQYDAWYKLTESGNLCLIFRTLEPAIT